MFQPHRFIRRGISQSHHLTGESRGSKQVWGMGDTLVSILGENVCSLEDWGAGGGAVRIGRHAHVVSTLCWRFHLTSVKEL